MASNYSAKKQMEPRLNIRHSCTIRTCHDMIDIEHDSINQVSKKLVRLEKAGSYPCAYRSVHLILGEDGLIISIALLLGIRGSVFFFSFFVLFVSLLLSLFQYSININEYSFRVSRLTL